MSIYECMHLCIYVYRLYVYRIYECRMYASRIFMLLPSD